MGEYGKLVAEVENGIIGEQGRLSELCKTSPELLSSIQIPMCPGIRYVGRIY